MTPVERIVCEELGIDPAKINKLSVEIESIPVPSVDGFEAGPRWMTVRLVLAPKPSQRIADALRETTSHG